MSFDLDHNHPYIIRVPNVLSQTECEAWIKRIEAGNPTVATINSSLGVHVNTNIRNNDRVILDTPELATDLFERIRERVPQEMHGMTLVGANERLRLYRYRPGQYFAPHSDGCYQRNQHERSYYTFMIYLNHGFEGGETAFITEPPISVTPETGMALFFQHSLIHEGSEVTSGTKYVLRSDLMYRDHDAG